MHWTSLRSIQKKSTRLIYERSRNLATLTEVRVPDIGNFTGVEVIEVAVRSGSLVKAEDSLITLETEKAAMDVPTPVSGKIHEMKIKLGDKVSQGDLIALIEVEADATEKTIETKSKESEKPAVSETLASAVETKTITVPDTGAASHVEVIEVAIKPGDEVALDNTLITLESEKASMDIPSPEEGKVLTVLVKVGDKVTAGTPILTMEVTGTKEESKKTKTEPTPIIPLIPQKSPALPSLPIQQTKLSFVHAGPATRRFARELGVDLTQVNGSGLRGRIVTKDVQAFVKSVMATGATTSGVAIEKAPEIDFSQFGEIEIKPLSRIKKWTAKNLHRNWVSIPHVTQFDEADITELEIFRQENKQAAMEHGIKLTPLAFIIKAVESTLKTYPQFNASLAANGVDLVLKKYFHIGVAMDTPNGLVVPVIRDVDTKGLFDLAKELGELSSYAKLGKLTAEQMQGSCFTISSLGSVGGTAFTPIINAPDVAILGVSKTQLKPIYINGEWVPRQILPLSLSYDHRVIDGVEAARFAAALAAGLQDIRKLLF